MIRRLPLFVLGVLGLALSVVTCSDDNSPTGGGSKDVNPPYVTNVTSPDWFHVNIVFSEPVPNAIRPWNFLLTRGQKSAGITNTLAPEDTVRLVATVLLPDKRTVAITTEIPMEATSYTLSVNDVEDVSGNAITTPVKTVFDASTSPDVTAPTVMNVSPAAGATRVKLGPRIMMNFSEPISFDSFSAGASWTDSRGKLVSWSGGGGGFDVGYELSTSTPLEQGTSYTIKLSGIQDVLGNTMPDVQWTFQTGYSSDKTSPRVVSTTPSDRAENVDVNVAFVMNFSEPIDRSLSWGIHLSPWSGAATVDYLNDDKTFIFQPLAPLLPNQQYRLTIYPRGVFDLGGNGIEGMHTAVFTTGAHLQTGSISGVLGGDAGTVAADPTGAMVFAVAQPYYEMMGSAVVEGNNTFTMPLVQDGTYFITAILDSNHDGMFNPYRGDATGAYGMSGPLDDSLQSVDVVQEGKVTNINFSINDPSVISGNLAYAGTSHGTWAVGVFTKPNFDPGQYPVASVYGDHLNRSTWSINSFFSSLVDGDYYLFAYLDTNNNYSFEPSIDPAGAYGGRTPVAVHVANGKDTSGIVISLRDPVGINSSASVTWVDKHNTQLEGVYKAVERATHSMMQQ